MDRLERELATARGEVSEAAAASRRANAHREEAEELVCRLNDSKLVLVREVRTTKRYHYQYNMTACNVCGIGVGCLVVS